ncbi:MAG: peptide chain release factor aRF-1 [Candidatus Diapherotrites archaeon]
MVEDSDVSLFKKKLKKLKEFKGKGTELITLYIPPGADRSSVMGQLTEELSQSSNIKSPTTRKNVQSAIRRINSFLKSIDFKIPENGIVLFCGNVSEVEGRPDIRMFVLRPIDKLKTKLYWCDDQFHLAPLEEMIKPSEIYGLVVIDKREATIALLKGKRYEILGRFTSGVAGKTRAGGQSSVRFERLREEAAQEFFKRVSEKMNSAFLPSEKELKGLIIGGPGMTKNEFLNVGTLDSRLKQKVIGIVDTSYTDESGIREIFFKSEEILKDTEIIKEKKILGRFLEEIVKNGLVAYGQQEVEEALNLGKAKTLLVSEGIEWIVYKIQCTACNSFEEVIVKNPDNFDEAKIKCSKCSSSTQIELLEEIDYIDFLIEKAHAIHAETRVISVDTSEGEQFLKGFGGIGAFLRYK